MKKYLVEVSYRKEGANSIIFEDTMIVTSVDDYNKADYKIRQYLTSKYCNNEQMRDIYITSFDLIEKITVK